MIQQNTTFIKQVCCSEYMCLKLAYEYKNREFLVFFTSFFFSINVFFRSSQIVVQRKAKYSKKANKFRKYARKKCDSNIPCSKTTSQLVLSGLTGRELVACYKFVWNDSRRKNFYGKIIFNQIVAQMNVLFTHRILSHVIANEATHWRPVETAYLVEKDYMRLQTNFWIIFTLLVLW